MDLSKASSGGEKTAYDEDTNFNTVKAVTPAESGLQYDVDPDLINEEENTTHRGLSARMVTMIAIGGSIGSGLIIGSGAALTKAGPVGLLIGYALVGLICYTVLTALGEMATHLPDKRGFPGYSARFVDEAAGFMTGWNYICKYAIVSPNQIVAAVVTIQYWNQSINPAAWCAIFILVIALINTVGVKLFGEVEFWMSTCKVLVLTGLLILSIVLDLGGGPSHDRLGFRYWKDPGPFSHYIYNNKTGVFLGVWYAFPNALFAYIGSELIGVTVGEVQNPRRNIPRAIKSTFWRILIFYVGLIFLVGLLVPSNSTQLATANKASSNAAASPFVVAIQIAGIKGLPGFINACILLFVFSAANSDTYVLSRTLFQMACQKQAPAFFMKTNRWGIPYIALICSLCCLTLSFICVSSSALVIFRYFTSTISMFGALTWMSLLVSHIRFKKAMIVQNFDQSTLVYKAPFGKTGSYIALGATIILTFFKGYDSFMPSFSYKTFITNYVGFLAAVCFYAGWKIYNGTTLVALDQIDLYSGHRVFGDEPQVSDLERYGTGWKGKVKKLAATLVE